jgi:hypothetical protein
MMLYRRQNQCWGYEERKEKRLRTFTAGPSTQYQNERNATRQSSSDTTTSTAKTITTPPKLVWRTTD